MLTVWLIILYLVAVNAFYVTAEFGSVSVRRSKVRQLAEGGHRLVSRLLPVLEDPARLDRYIAACQIGVTWSSLVLGAYSQAAFYTLPPMKVSLVAYAWFLKILNGSGLAILRLLGFSQVGHGHIHSPEEIELLIAESRKGGLLEPDEHERLHKALRLVSRPVRQLIVPRSHVVSIDVNATSEDLVSLLKASRTRGSLFAKDRRTTSFV
jgi:CBS domain containing-hemolysin-like protein